MVSFAYYREPVAMVLMVLVLHALIVFKQIVILTRDFFEKITDAQTHVLERVSTSSGCTLELFATATSLANFAPALYSSILFVTSINLYAN